ncbi:MAG: hypothetical protein ABIK65_04340 [Candidatus Eisenbacteria bacterium]
MKAAGISRIGLVVAFVAMLFGCGGDDGPAGPDSNTLVRTLVDEAEEAGSHTVVWDLLDHGGAPAVAGVYRAVVRLENETAEDVFSIVDAEPSPGAHPAAPGTIGPAAGRFQPVPLSIEATPDPVATGSGLWIEFVLPRAGQVLLWIEED